MKLKVLAPPSLRLVPTVFHTTPLMAAGKVIRTLGKSQETAIVLEPQTDWHSARQMIVAITRRLENPRGGTADYRERLIARRLCAETVNRVLVPLDEAYKIPLPRSPDVAQILCELYGDPSGEACVTPLHHVLGLVGARERYKKGCALPNGMVVYPRVGVFPPTRGDYLALVWDAINSVLSSGKVPIAGEIGTGCGALALMLASKVEHVVAVDCDARAVRNATENVARFGLQKKISVIQCDAFPPEPLTAPLWVCNPPWIPVTQEVSGPEGSVFDHTDLASRFVVALASRLRNERSEGWLIMSNIAELWGLRSPDYWMRLFADSGLRVIEKRQAAPRPDSKECVSLWRLGKQ